MANIKISDLSALQLVAAEEAAMVKGGPLVVKEIAIKATIQTPTSAS